MIAAWWARWRVVFWLCAVIAGLAALNVWQWKRAITAPLRGQVAGLEQALEDSEQINVDVKKSTGELIAAADATARRLLAAGKGYDAAARSHPLTPDNCGPGQGRVDATNHALGSSAANGESSER